MLYEVITEIGGEQSDVALIAACYSVGFLAGCLLGPRHIHRIGYPRSFTAAAAVLTRITSYNVCYTKLLRIAANEAARRAVYWSVSINYPTLRNRIAGLIFRRPVVRSESRIDFPNGRPQPLDIVGRKSYNFV